MKNEITKIYLASVVLKEDGDLKITKVPDDVLTYYLNTKNSLDEQIVYLNSLLNLKKSEKEYMDFVRDSYGF